MLTFEDETVQSEKPRMNGALSDAQMPTASRPSLAVSRVTSIKKAMNLLCGAVQLRIAWTSPKSSNYRPAAVGRSRPAARRSGQGAMLETCGSGGCERFAGRRRWGGRTFPIVPMQVLKQGQRANAGREGTSVLTVVGQEAAEKPQEPVSLLDQLVRDGARQMLAAALQAEVAAYIEQFADVRDEDGHRLVVRNGYHAERAVVTGAGAVTVQAPRVNDKRVDQETGERQRFSSAILPAWARKSPKVAEVLPLLYLHGLSSLDFGPALEQFLGTGAGLSAATITRLTAQWQDEARGLRRSVAGRAWTTSICGSTGSCATRRCMTEWR